MAEFEALTSPRSLGVRHQNLEARYDKKPSPQVLPRAGFRYIGTR